MQVVFRQSRTETVDDDTMMMLDSEDLDTVSRGQTGSETKMLMLPPAVAALLAEVLKYNSGRLAPSYVKQQARQGARVIGGGFANVS